MINVIKGNIFTTSCQVVVNTTNCVGVMGAGIALECKLRYPEMYKKYVELCAAKKIDIGMLWIYKAQDRWILNFPTKKHWKYPSKEEYLHQGLEKFVATYKERGIESIAFPLLGADKGGIKPDVSLDIMTSYLNGLDLDIEIYKFDKNAKDDIYEGFKDWLNNNSVSYISSAAGISGSSVLKILEATNNTEICQLNQIASLKGVGIKTLEKIYKTSINIRDGRIK